MTEPRRYIQGFEVDDDGVVLVPSGVAPGYPDLDKKNDEEEGSDA